MFKLARFEVRMRSVPPEVEFAENGLRYALERLQVVTPSVGIGVVGNEYLYPFFETLAWLYGLHEWYRDVLPDFFTIRDADVGGQTLAAVLWARGEVHHRLLDASKLVTGPSSVLPARLPMVLAGTRTAVHWLASAQLPPGLAADRYGRDVLYRNLVGDKPLLVPLMVARAFLVTFG